MAFKPFQVGNYRFVELLDRGGTAEVFRVECTDERGFLKSFAVKRVTTHSQFDDKSAENLKREAKVHRLLTHPNIARLYDAVRAKKSLFLVVEFVDGLNLRSVARKLEQRGERMPTGLCTHLMLKVAAAMAYAHKVADPETGKALHVIHRDLTPRNLMLSREGEIKVIDFGIASAANITRGTATGCVRGTLAYMAPEQAGGQGSDQRADIYSVGLMLLELLAGGRIFEGDSEIELLRKITEGHLPRASEHNPEVSAELDRIVAKATARIPGDRYQSMDLFRRDLERVTTIDAFTASRQLADLIKSLMKEKRSAVEASPNVSWEEPALSPHEERAIRDGFRKMEGALGLELENYTKTHQTGQPLVNYAQRLDWTPQAERLAAKGNRSAILWALLLSLGVGVFLARTSKTVSSLKKPPVLTSKASMGPNP